MNTPVPRWIKAPLPLLSLGVSIVIAAGLPLANMRTAVGAESMVLHSVHCALPLFLVAFVASSLVRLRPSRVTRWLLRNRRAFGLGFAVGMAWHLAFVVYFMAKFDRHLNGLALGMDLIGLAFLIALTATSYRSVRRLLPPRSWTLLHRTGVHVIWLLVAWIYLLSARYSPDLSHLATLVVLLGVLGIRVLSWQSPARRRISRHTGPI